MACWVSAARVWVRLPVRQMVSEVAAVAALGDDAAFGIGSEL